MAQKLKLLLLEDKAEDSELTLAALEEAGYSCEWERVETRKDFLDRLKTPDYDLILSDYSLPTFDGLTALKLFIELDLDIPFILISGTFGEETAIDSIMAGATDYVLKDKLFRLPFVIQRALKEAYDKRLIVKAEKRLKLQAAALESAANAIVITDLDGTITWVNPAFTSLTGYSSADAVGQNPRILNSGKHNARFFRNLWETITAGKTWHGEMVNRRKDGSTYIEEQTITPVVDDLGKVTNFVAIKLDITARKRAEEAIRESEQRFQVLEENSWDAVHLLSAEGIILYESPVVFRLLGYTPDELVGKNSFEMVHPDDLAATAVGFAPIVETPGMTASTEVRVLHKDGSWRWMECIATNLLEHPAIQAVAVNYRDITERKQAADALRESEERYRELVENAIDIIYTHDLEGNYLSVNQAGQKITGYTRDETLRMNLADTVAPEYIQTAKKMIADKLAGAEVTAYEIEIIAKDGHRVTVEVNTRIIYENGNPVRVQGIARDVTERKNLQEQFLQAQKMESIGVLAGGVAHDFNNLLTAINGYSDLTLRRMAEDDPLRHNIQEIRDSGDRAAALTAQLLAFSRKQVLTPTVHNLNSVITNMEKMLRRLIRESIEFRIILEPQLGNIRADLGQIEQVIMNLAVNAHDAMLAGGTLTIETQNVYLDENYVSQHISVRPGPFVKLTVTDNGEGMDSKTQKHIFEPFFTTKAVGNGTGLGLSTVYGIIKQSGGDIMVYSEIGHGTTFKVYFPCVDENVQKIKGPDERKDAYLGTETVLVVEDETAVRRLIHEILTGNGYTVLEASSGREALEICSKSPDPIHLLLSDVIMPQMGGNELKKRVVELLPDIKVLFISGYTYDSIADSRIDDPRIAFLEKPFSPEILIRKVRDVLDG